MTSLIPSAPFHRAIWLVAAAAVTACAPPLNWREVRVGGSAVQLLFPCKPDTQERRVALAGSPVQLVLNVCEADGQIWALALADVAEPARVAPALAALQAGAAANLGTRPAALAPLAVPGATPQTGSGRTRLQGQRGDGQKVQMQTLVFASGTQVFQASVLGAALAEEDVEAYFTSIRLVP